MNFLFFSKLLPIFLYPLGLVFSLLGLSLLLWWKYPRWVPIPLVIALFIISIAGNSLLSDVFAKTLEWQYISEPQAIPSAEAIVILGGGLKPKVYPRPMIDLAEQGDRVIYGAKLYKMNKAPLIITTGGRIKWQNAQLNASEADDMKELLMLFDIPESAIVTEGDSYNTHDNAVNTKVILDDLQIDRVILVTSALHMPRAIKVFEKQGIGVIPAPTDYLVSQNQLEFNSTWQRFLLSILPNSNSLDKTTVTMKEYLGTFIYRLKGWI